jgi:hypothetical protein
MNSVVRAVGEQGSDGILLVPYGMPYSIIRRPDRWCVIKDDDGRVMGCHVTLREAEAQLTALRIAEANRYRIEQRPR